MNIPNLFTSVRPGALEAPNRIIMAPLTRMRAEPSRVPTSLMAEFYAQRPAGGLIDENFYTHQGVEDNDLNMICFGGVLVGHALAWELTQTFLAARFRGAERFRRRLEKVAQLEAKVKSTAKVVA